MKTILFTGARSGIISHVIDEIIDDYKIYITVHTHEQLKGVRKKYKDFSNVTCFKLDVTNKQDLFRLKQLDIDILVSSAAIGESGSIAEIDMNKVRHNFEVNVFSNFELVQIVIRNMLEKKRGRIIIISSLAGMVPVPFGGAYSASKASISRLTECLNLELKLLDTNIDVCLIEPGLYKTGFNKLLFDQKYDWMSIDSYFKHQIDFIRNTENIVLRLFERKNFDSIVKKIKKAIVSDNPKFIYSSPFYQNLFSRLYGLFR